MTSVLMSNHRGHRGTQRKVAFGFAPHSERYRACANKAQRRSGYVRAHGTGEDARPPANLIA